MNWTYILVSIFLIVWGLIALYSAFKNDNKSRFLILGGLGQLFDYLGLQRLGTRLTNIFWGSICLALGIGLLLTIIKHD
jgi:hypothetical protein